MPSDPETPGSTPGTPAEARTEPFRRIPRPLPGPPVPRALPARATPPPTVNPPGHHTRPAFAAHTGDEHAATVINRVLDAADTARPTSPAGPGRPRPNPRRPGRDATVGELAAARMRHADRHQRHMDTLEIIRAYLGAACLIAVFLLIVALALVALGIMSGAFVWMPVRPAG